MKSLNNFLNPTKCTCPRTTQLPQPQVHDDVENAYLLKGGKKTNIADIKRKHGYPSDVKSDEEDKDNTSAVANESLPLEIQVKKPFSSRRMFNPTPARKA